MAKKAVKILSVVFAIALIGVMLLPLAVPADAYGDYVYDNTYYSFYNFTLTFSSYDSSGLGTYYVRELPYAFNSTEESYYFKDGDNSNTVLSMHSFYGDDTSLGNYNFATLCPSGYGCSYMKFSQNGVLFVDGDVGLPILRFGALDVDLTILVTISGKYLIEDSDVSAGTFIRTTEDFSISEVVEIESESLYGVSNLMTAVKMKYDAWIDQFQVVIFPTNQDDVVEFTSLWMQMRIVDEDSYNEYQEAIVNLWPASFTANTGGSVAGVDFVGWLSTAVGAFWDFELFPGMSIEGIVYGVLGLGLAFLFLKFFAGG